MHRCPILLTFLLSSTIILPVTAKPVKHTPNLQKKLAALTQALELQQQQITEQRQLIVQQQQALAALRAELSPPTETHKLTTLPHPDAELLAKVDAQKATVDKLAESIAQQKLAEQDRPRWSFNNGRPTFSSADGRFTLALRALVQLDVGYYDQAPQPALDFRRGSVGATGNRENVAAGDLSSGAYFRRARFGFEGTFNRDFDYQLLGEFGGSGTEGPVRLAYAWVGYNGFAPFSLRLGAFSPPANLDDGTAAGDGLFIERAAGSDLSRSLAGALGRIGVNARYASQRLFASLAITTRTVNDAEVNDAQLALVGRVGALAATGDDYNIHIGANGTYVFQPADQGLGTNPRYGIRLRERPELRVDGTRLIDTGPIDAASSYNAGLELAANYRSLFLQGEYFFYGIERRASTLSDPRFNGYYIEGSWLLTGEARRYNSATASFQNPRPQVPFTARGGYGAWELALRYSDIDLNYRSGLAGTAPAPDAVRGGHQTIWTAGLNWYLNSTIKFLFDYQRVNIDRLNPGASLFGTTTPALPVGVQIGQDYNAFSFRSQFSF